MENTGAASLDFAAIYREHGRGLREAIRFYGVPARDADDVVQEALVAVWKSLGRYDPGRPLMPWLRTIVYRTARDYLKRLRRSEQALRQPAEGKDVISSSPTVDCLIADRQRQTVVREILRSCLPIFAMAVVDGLSPREIGQAIGLPESTALSRLRTARREFDGAVSRFQARTAAGR